MFDGFLDALAAILGVKKSAAVVGFVSAIVSLRFVPEMTGWKSRLSMASGGFFCAVYVAPGIAEYFQFKERTEYAIVFGVGMLGMSLAAAMVKVVTSGELWGMIRDRVGGRRAQDPIDRPKASTPLDREAVPAEDDK